MSSGAIAAGNCVVIKPSEVAPATAEVFATLLPRYIDSQCYPVVLGGPEETKELLQHRFDYIFFTGSPQVGKIIYQAASKHLTPVTLEMGGKSPVYIDSTVDMEVAAKRIMWGKIQNAGQVCISPDYILCTKKVQEKFIICAGKALQQFYDGRSIVIFFYHKQFRCCGNQRGCFLKCLHVISPVILLELSLCLSIQKNQVGL